MSCVKGESRLWGGVWVSLFAANGQSGQTRIVPSIDAQPIKNVIIRVKFMQFLNYGRNHAVGDMADQLSLFLQ